MSVQVTKEKVIIESAVWKCVGADVYANYATVERSGEDGKVNTLYCDVLDKTNDTVIGNIRYDRNGEKTVNMFDIANMSKGAIFFSEMIAAIESDSETVSL